jgi:hypothetical protein
MGVAVAIARWSPFPSRAASGVAAGVAIAFAFAYVAFKRARARPGARGAFIAHLAIGAVTCGAVAAHAGARLARGVAGALEIAFVAVVLSGAFVALAYAVVPRRLSRLERRGALPEDLAARAREMDERVFGALTGTSDVVKALFARVLRPYARAPLGAIALVVRGVTVREEEARVRAKVDRALAGHRSARLDGLDRVVRLVVERRALVAQRWLLGVLGAGVPLHVVATAVALVLLAVHVVLAVRAR